MLNKIHGPWGVPAGTSSLIKLKDFDHLHLHLSSSLYSLFYVLQTPPMTMTWPIPPLLAMLKGYCSKLPTSKNYLYFLKFVHIHVALHRTIPNHLKLCPYDEKWPSYEAHNLGTWKFSNFDFIPKKAASPGLLQTAVRGVYIFLKS